MTIKTDHLASIPAEITVELGRTQMSIQQLLQLSPGDMVLLKHLVTEPLNIYVNGLLFAKGEVVDIQGKPSIRIVKVLSPEERLHHA